MCYEITQLDCLEKHGRYKGDESICEDVFCIIFDPLFKEVKNFHHKFVIENILGSKTDTNRDLLKQFEKTANQYIDYFLNDGKQEHLELREVKQKNNAFFVEVVKEDIVKNLNYLLNDLDDIKKGHHYKKFKHREDGGDKVVDVHLIISMLVEVQSSVSMYSKILEDYVNYLDSLEVKSKKIPESSYNQEEFRSGKIMEQWREELRDEGLKLPGDPDIDLDGNNTIIPEIIASPELDELLNVIIVTLEDLKKKWESEQGN